MTNAAPETRHAEREAMISGVDAVGWAASLVLFLTLGREVWVQWRERCTAGMSGWLFVGQITASVGFIIYSVLLANVVFIVANVFILSIAICGQVIYRRNVRHGD